MPRNVRNFWLTLNVDGRDMPIATGPVGKDGGFTLKIEQRDSGSILHTLDLEGVVSEDGNIALHVYRGSDIAHDVIRHAVIETKR